MGWGACLLHFGIGLRFDWASFKILVGPDEGENRTQCDTNGHSRRIPPSCLFEPLNGK
jgi:hypothetical protein